MKSSYKPTYAAFVAIALLAIAFSATAGPHVQEMRGLFEGYIQSETNPPDPVRIEITEQVGRRFGGLLDVGGPHVIEGTVSASGRVNYQSKSVEDHVVGNLDLHDLGEGGAIQVGTQKIIQKNGGFILPCVLVMRAFAGDGSVVPGEYTGELEGGGEIRIALSSRRDPDQPSRLDGVVEVMIDGVTHSFDLIASSSESGKFIAIGHNPDGKGHLIIKGAKAGPHVLEGKIILEVDEGHEIEFDFEASGGILTEDVPTF